MKNKYPAVEVEWIDSMKSSGWHDFKKSDMRCRSVGILYDNTKDRIVIAQNKSSVGFGDYMEIPKAAVTRIRKLK